MKSLPLAPLCALLLGPLASCSADSGDDENVGTTCDPVGTWTLISTADTGGCFDLFEAAEGAEQRMLISESGDEYRVSLLGDTEAETIICMSGRIEQTSCSGSIVCQVTEDGNSLQESYTLQFAADGVEGSSAYTIGYDGFSCSSTNEITGTR